MTETRAVALRLGLHSIVYGASRIAVSGFDLLLSPLYARALAPDAFGLIAVAISFQAGIGILFTCGLDGALFRLFHTPGATEPDRRRALGSVSLGVITLTLAIVGVLLTLGPGLFGNLLGGMSSRIYSLVLIGSACNVVPVLVLQSFQLRQESLSYLTFATAYAGLRGLATVIAVVGLERGVAGWAESFVVAAAISGGVAAVWLFRTTDWRAPGPVLREAFGYAVPQLVHQASGWLALAASRPLLAAMVTLPEVATYYVAFGIAQGLGLVSTAVSLAYGPAFMAAAAKSEVEAAGTFGRILSRYIAGLIALAGVVALWRDVAVQLFAGAAHLDAVRLVPVALVVFLLQGVYVAFVGPVFWRKESVRRLPMVTIPAAVVGLGGIAVLVPLTGLWGAAWAALGSHVIMVVGVYVLAQRSIRMRFEWSSIAWVAVVTVGCVTGATALNVRPLSVPGILMTTVATAIVALNAAGAITGMLRIPQGSRHA